VSPCIQNYQVTSTRTGSIVSRVQTGQPEFDSWQRKKNFPLASVSRPALKSTEPPMQWVPGLKCCRGMTLTTHPYLVLRLRMSRSCISSPWCLHGAAGQLYFTYVWRTSFGWFCAFKVTSPRGPVGFTHFLCAVWVLSLSAYQPSS
jgi:hypothetical protein